MKRLLLAVLCAGLFVFGSSVNASANPIINPEVLLNVTYTAGQIEDGPLSFGLTALPSEVNAMFWLGSPAITPEPGDPTEYGLGDVSSAMVSFGDGLWTQLATFSMLVDAGNVTSLDYQFSAINTATTSGPVILNFPLTITGTDTASGLDFEYQYANSTQSIDPVPEPATMLLLGTGLVGVAGAARRRKKNQA